jgi:hypothetical protein
VNSALRLLGVAASLFVFAAPQAWAAQPPPDPCRNLQIAGIAVTDDLTVGPLGVDFGKLCATTASSAPEATTVSPKVSAPGAPEPSSAPRTAGTPSARTSAKASPPPPSSGTAAVITAKAATARPVSAAKERASARSLAVRTKRRWALVTLLLIVGSGVVLHQRS